MLIREANIDDKNEIYDWRNDFHTRKMFFNNLKIKKKEHELWFKNILKSKLTTLYVGEINKNKIGVCRFDIKKELKSSEVSINLNPDYRGKGFSKILLDKSINTYLENKTIDLVAEIKKDNPLSIDIFQKVGFFKKEIRNDKFIFILPKNKLKFIDVMNEPKSVEILFNLLKKRKFSISHKNMPSLKSHESFVKNNPYLSWYIIYYKDKPIGSIYLKRNNSIGLDLSKASIEWVSQILFFVKKSFQLQSQKLSVIPEYFYFNVSIKNKKLINILRNLCIEPIQISFKI